MVILNSCQTYVHLLTNISNFAGCVKFERLAMQDKHRLTNILIFVCLAWLGSAVLESDEGHIETLPEGKIWKFTSLAGAQW